MQSTLLAPAQRFRFEAEQPNTGEPRAADDAVERLLILTTPAGVQTITFEGNVVVFGDVNPGIEIIASGDVFVWGKLFGAVYAGWPNNNRAIVGALRLWPTRLQIGSYIRARRVARRKIRPLHQVARIRRERIIVENKFNPDRRFSRSAARA